MMKRSTDKGSDREKGVFCMPSTPKVQKEIILKTAFELLLCEGYGAINIKTVAQQLGCSTQPISRQFGSMDGFRKELLEYGIEQLGSFFSMEGERVSDIVAGIESELDTVLVLSGVSTIETVGEFPYRTKYILRDVGEIVG